MSEIMLPLEFFVLNFTCNDTDVTIYDHFTGEVLTTFNTNDIIEGETIFGGARYIVEFVKPLDKNRLAIEVIDPYEVFKPENDPTKW
jgi:hypothetical protein